MGLLFHNAHRAEEPQVGGGLPSTELEARSVALRAAVEAHLLGRMELARGGFTTDVVCTTPHVTINSLDSLDAICGVPEEALSEPRLTIRSFLASGDCACAEWRLDATFTGPALLEDDVLIEPTGDRVHLTGATVAQFQDDLISSIRHYFDDSELLSGVTVATRYRRWLAGSPDSGATGPSARQH